MHSRSPERSQLVCSEIYVQNLFVFNIDGLLTTGLSAGDIDLYVFSIHTHWHADLQLTCAYEHAYMGMHADKLNDMAECARVQLNQQGNSNKQQHNNDDG